MKQRTKQSNNESLEREEAGRNEKWGSICKVKTMKIKGELKKINIWKKKKEEADINKSNIKIWNKFPCIISYPFFDFIC